VDYCYDVVSVEQGNGIRGGIDVFYPTCRFVSGRDNAVFD